MKLVAAGPALLAGAVVAFWRVKMLTPEQLILVRLRGLTAIAPQGHVKEREKEDVPGDGARGRGGRGLQMEADNAESFTSLSMSGRWKRTKLPRRVSLYVDGVPRPGAEALATPVSETESGYTIIFLPTTADIGVQELAMRVKGEEKPIYKRKVDVKVKGTRSLEMKKVS